MRKIFIAAILLSIVACKKNNSSDNNNPPSTKSKSDQLKAGKWKISELKFSNEGGEQDLLDVTEDCAKDNFYFFNNDQSITVDEGATKCDADAAQQTTDGQWLLESSDTKLTFKDSKIFSSDESSTVTLDVLGISDSEIAFSKDSTVVIPGLGTISGKFSGKFFNVK